MVYKRRRYAKKGTRRFSRKRSYNKKRFYKRFSKTYRRMKRIAVKASETKMVILGPTSGSIALDPEDGYNVSIQEITSLIHQGTDSNQRVGRKIVITGISYQNMITPPVYTGLSIASGVQTRRPLFQQMLCTSVGAATSPINTAYQQNPEVPLTRDILKTCNINRMLFHKKYVLNRTWEYNNIPSAPDEWVSHSHPRLIKWYKKMYMPVTYQVGSTMDSAETNLSLMTWAVDPAYAVVSTGTIDNQYTQVSMLLKVYFHDA